MQKKKKKKSCCRFPKQLGRNKPGPGVQEHGSNMKNKNTMTQNHTMTQQRQSEGAEYKYLGHQVRVITRESQDTGECDDTNSPRRDRATDRPDTYCPL